MGREYSPGNWSGARISGAGSENRSSGIGSVGAEAADGFSTRGLLVVLFDQLVAHRADFQKGFGFFVETLALAGVEGGFAQDAEDGFRAEIIFVVEAVDGGEDFVGGQAGVLDVGELVSTFVDHFAVFDHESIFDGVVVEFGARVGVGYRDLDGFDVEFFGEGDGVVDGLMSFAGESEDEISVND